MGRGNVRVTGPCEGLYYIDNDDFFVYRRINSTDKCCEMRLLGELDYSQFISGEWLIDDDATNNERDDILNSFMTAFCRMFPSFKRVEGIEWANRERRIILKNRLFFICLEDNEWSLAIELIQREDPYGLPWMENFQKRLYQKYLEGMKKALLNKLSSIGTYAGPWTSGRIKREECIA